MLYDVWFKRDAILQDNDKRGDISQTFSFKDFVHCSTVRTFKCSNENFMCLRRKFSNIFQFYRTRVKQHIQERNYLQVVAILYGKHVFCLEISDDFNKCTGTKGNPIH